jgi:ABC-type cobalamin/Fe3+-siderophores transport system ATPase subunit
MAADIIIPSLAADAAGVIHEFRQLKQLAFDPASDAQLRELLRATAQKVASWRRLLEAFDMGLLDEPTRVACREQIRVLMLVEHELADQNVNEC